MKLTMQEELTKRECFNLAPQLRLKVLSFEYASQKSSEKSH